MKEDIIERVEMLVAEGYSDIVHPETINKICSLSYLLKNRPLRILVDTRLGIDSVVHYIVDEIKEFLKQNTKFDNSEQYLSFSDTCFRLGCELERYTINVLRSDPKTLKAIEDSLKTLLQWRNLIEKYCDDLSKLEPNMVKSVDVVMKLIKLELKYGLCEFLRPKDGDTRRAFNRKTVSRKLFEEFCSLNDLDCDYPVTCDINIPSNKQYINSTIKWGSDPYGQARWKLVERFEEFLQYRIETIESKIS
jgi:hypothetical protein